MLAMCSPTSSRMRLITVVRSSWWPARRATGCRGRPQAGCGNGSLTPDDLPYASNAHKGSAVIRSGSAGNVILVTGAGGQVGSRLSSLLRAAGHRVLAVDIHANALENVEDRKSTRLNSSHVAISYAVFCLKKKKK